MIVPLHQPVASVVVSQLSKLHGHSHNNSNDIWHCLHLWLKFSHLITSELNKTILKYVLIDQVYKIFREIEI